MGLTLTDIVDAKVRITKFLTPSPLLRCVNLEKKLGYEGKIFLKLDCEQPTGSFKVRGAFNNLMQFTPVERKKGVVTRSSGNFAQAVSYAANKLKMSAIIVMPEDAPNTKVEGTKKWGAEVILSGTSHAEGENAVKKLIEDKGLIPVHPYNDYRTMAGQGTAALEILEQCPEIEHFFCPIGGGGLMSGCSVAFKEIDKSIYTHGIEPEGAADYHASRQSGKREVWKKVETIADGLRAPTVGELNYPILNENVDDTDVVSESEIKSAMRDLYDSLELVTEPSGAVAYAGFLKRHKSIKGDVVIFVSGKNVDPEPFKKWIQEA